MTRLHSQIDIEAPADEVWALLSDLAAIESYHPAVKRAYYLGEQREGPGASRRCEFGGGRSIDETVVASKAGEWLTLKLHDGRMMPPFGRAEAKMSVESLGDATRVHFDMEYRLRYGPVGLLMDQMMVRKQFSKALPAVLRGLKKKIENNAAKVAA